MRIAGSLAGALAGGLALGCAPGVRGDPSPRLGAYPFALGVASGDPSPDGFVLWTRLAPDPLAGGGTSERRVRVDWELAGDEGFRRVVHRGSSLAVPELAHSVHVVVEDGRPGVTAE